MRVDREKRESDFNKTLEEFKDPKTGHIMLSPEQAKDIIYRSFLSDSRAPLGRSTKTVEVLAQIAEKEGGTFDFTKGLEQIEFREI